MQIGLDRPCEPVLSEDMEFHIFELPKFRPSSDNINSLPQNEKWLYLFQHAVELDTVVLSEQLGEPAYLEALGVLQMISRSPEDFRYYEERLKFLRDEEGKLLAAREEGKLEGKLEGRLEGKLVGRSQTLQELLGEAVMKDDDLAALELQALNDLTAELQRRLRSRDV